MVKFSIAIGKHKGNTFHWHCTKGHRFILKYRGEITSTSSKKIRQMDEKEIH
jgi:hypothetical protein